ncbi:TetR/AcrR family transcriptional regulator [Nonomuraea sp. NPDC002799]
MAWPPGTSIEAVAQRAGVAKLTVYRRWRAKDDLLMAALEHARTPDMDAAPVGQSIDDLVSSVAELLSQPRFRALMARVIGASVDYPKLVIAYTERYLRPRLDALARIAQQAAGKAGHRSGVSGGGVAGAAAGHDSWAPEPCPASRSFCRASGSTTRNGRNGRGLQADGRCFRCRRAFDGDLSDHVANAAGRHAVR